LNGDGIAEQVCRDLAAIAGANSRNRGSRDYVDNQKASSPRRSLVGIFVFSDSDACISFTFQVQQG
jgi:hypothetical protein